MTPLDSNTEALQQSLQEQLQKEVYLMRELLSNMHQEEISRMLHDNTTLATILDSRSALLDKLGSLRKVKFSTLQTMHTKSPYLPFSIEMSFLHDQLTTLSEKIHRQFSTNRRLADNPDRYTYPSHYQQEQKKQCRKTKITTLQIKP